MSAEIDRVHRENYGVHGYRKVYAQLACEQIVVADRQGAVHCCPADARAGTAWDLPGQGAADDDRRDRA